MRNGPDIEPLVARDASYYRAPEALRRRIREAAAAETGDVQRHAFWRWGGMAAAFALVGWMSWNAALWRAGGDAQDRLEREVAGAHIRSLMVANRFSDVLSTDQHTVKPWFQGKIDFAPVVADLPKSGFALQGGRLDYVDGRPVAAITYRLRLHAVNLFEWPAAGEVPPKLAMRDGYSLVRWRRGGLHFCLVSDASGAELLKFAQQLSQGYSGTPDG